jgi:hypothetical protein
MHWIPEEAIMATMRVDEFLTLARHRGVIDGEQSFNTLNVKESMMLNYARC